jgi:hypothetical protein
MEVTTHDLLSLLHGVGFGALFMLAFSGALAELYRQGTQGQIEAAGTNGRALLTFFIVVMVSLSWVTVFSGAYIIYPWYRAVPPSDMADLSDYPRRLLLSSGKSSHWHNVGMEWKEHIAWLAPIAITMVCYVVLRYGHSVLQQRSMRNAVLTFAVAAFFSTAVAGALGVLLKKYAPVRGGTTIILIRGGQQ